MALIPNPGLNAGDLDREITWQTATVTQDGVSGEEVLTYDPANDQTLWAQWLPAGTAEAWKAQQRLGAYVDGVFRIYDMDTRPDPKLNRILFDGKVFDPKPYVELGRGEGLEIPVTAHVGDA